MQIKTHQVAGNVYYLEGQGGNVGLLVGDDGVLMIDDQFAPLSEKLQAAIRALSNKPIRMLINTHVHGDHTGGNENFGKLGIDIVAHDNVRVRLARGVNGAAPSPAVALPVVTYGDTMSLHLNGETDHDRQAAAGAHGRRQLHSLREGRRDPRRRRVPNDRLPGRGRRQRRHA